MNLFVRWCLPVAAACLAMPVFAQADTFVFLQKPGTLPVGLRVIDQYDRSRTFPSAISNAGKPSKGSYRPLQTLIWYPARLHSGAPMTVGDYAALADSELRFDVPDAKGNKWREQLKGMSSVALWAVRDAVPADGRYPVVIYAPSDSSVSWENADLCEYLASHGYVVIASPSMGEATRDMTDDLPGIRAQARDISFLVSYARTLPDADVSKLAVLSWSWGGISSVFAAANDSRIRALVSMDGSMRYFPGLVKKAGDVHPEKMTLPLIFFTSEYPNYLEDFEAFYDGPAEDLAGPNVLNAWKHGDLTTVNMIGMSHGEFSSMFQRRKSAERFAEDQIADYGRDEANQGYAWVTRYVAAFLDARLKADAEAGAFLARTPAANGVPSHFMSIRRRPAQPINALPASGR
ncbi:dienelactone hydrolase [Luteibacter anthropi]|uniref:Dienelactone hydrolase n=1 Tax=Luteibacter anthropi TaxID=564369 RepID=A0A7X5UDI8_9GAMM|nr:dienelactone hydrolase [Luteibacter anthropi]NII08520.1 dienelactone hydrolase [Luteibacter anthropi]